MNRAIINICQIEQETNSYYCKMSEDETIYRLSYDEYVAGALDADADFAWCEERLGECGSFAQAVAAAIRDNKDDAALGAMVRALANQAIGQMADWHAANGGNK